MKKEILLVIVLAVIIVALAAFLWWPKNNASVVPTPTPTANLGIQILSPTPNEIISSPLKITGVVKGDGWNGFEGQVGSVTLIDASGKQLAQASLAATTDWMQLPVSFQTNLIFTAPSGTSGTLIFHNENPSGDPVRDKTVTLPVKFK